MDAAAAVASCLMHARAASNWLMMMMMMMMMMIDAELQMVLLFRALFYFRGRSSCKSRSRSWGVVHSCS